MYIKYQEQSVVHTERFNKYKYIFLWLCQLIFFTVASSRTICVAISSLWLGMGARKAVPCGIHCCTPNSVSIAH